jgi:hypothetical protein
MDSKKEERTIILTDIISSGVSYRGKIYSKEALTGVFNKQETRLKNAELLCCIERTKRPIAVISRLVLKEEGGEVGLEIEASLLETPQGNAFKSLIEEYQKDSKELNMEFFLNGMHSFKENKVSSVLLNSIDLRPKIVSNLKDDQGEKTENGADI